MKWNSYLLSIEVAKRGLTIGKDWIKSDLFLGCWSLSINAYLYHSFWCVKLSKCCSTWAPMSSDEEGGASSVGLDVSGLANEWDAETSIRSHLRESKQPLFNPDVSPDTVKACTGGDHIHAILKVMCQRTACVEGHPQAPVSGLREELRLLYQKGGQIPTESDIVTDSWMIRKLRSFIKMKCRRRKVSTVPYSKLWNLWELWGMSIYMVIFWSKVHHFWSAMVKGTTLLYIL